MVVKKDHAYTHTQAGVMRACRHCQENESGLGSGIYPLWEAKNDVLPQKVANASLGLESLR